MLTKYLQEFDVEKFANELIENLDYVTDEEISAFDRAEGREGGSIPRSAQHTARAVARPSWGEADDQATEGSRSVPSRPPLIEPSLCRCKKNRRVSTPVVS